MMSQIDKDSGFGWGRLIGYIVNGMVMYAFGYWIGQGGFQSPAPRPASSVASRWTNIRLEAGCPDGSITLFEAIADGQALSERLGCTIDLRYRNKSVLITRGRSHQELVEDYVQWGDRP